MTRLAINGGTPVCSAPLPHWPVFGDAEIRAAEQVLRSGRINYWTGDECRAFEAEYAESLGRRHAIALANGTLALELALRAFEIGPGDEVIVPARTFIATASAVIAVGATPVVADIDPVSSAVTAQSVAACITECSRAVIPVHVGGWPVDMDALMELAAQHDLVVIEDCAQAHGGTYRGRPLGSLGHAAAFSFCQDKIITTGGEGGLLVLDDDAAHRVAWEYKDHGKSLGKVNGTEPVPGRTFKWLHDSFGSNWRLTELQAAIGRVALSVLPEWHEKRTRNALRVAEALADTPGISFPLPSPESQHAFYRLYGRIDTGALADGWDRDRIIEAVTAEGVRCQFGSCAEIYREQAFVKAGLGPADRLPGAMEADTTSIAFFVHPTLEEGDMDVVAAAVAKVMAVAAR